MSTTADRPAASPRAPRWVMVTLVLSLAANLLVAGVVGATFWRMRHGPPPMRPFAAANSNILGFAASLPPERRRAIWRQTTSERQALPPLRAGIRAAREAARAALLADPFEPEAYAKAQSGLLQAEVRARTESQKLLLAIAGMLSKEERAAFARWQPGEGPPRGGQGPGKRWFRNGDRSGDRSGDRPPPPPEGAPRPQ